MGLKEKLYQLVQRAVVHSVDNANYTILDDDYYTEIRVTTGNSDRTIYLPTLADNQTRKIKIKKIDSGTGKVIVTPEGTEKINAWNATVEITEQWGWWLFTACSAEWEGDTDGNSTIYRTTTTSEVSLNTTTSMAWADALSISIPTGRYELMYSFAHGVVDASYMLYLYLFSGIGTTSGNNSPDIVMKLDLNFYLSSAYLYLYLAHAIGLSIRYSFTNTTTIYLKGAAQAQAANFPLTEHRAYGSVNYPVILEARRIR